ncbi:MAG: XTP/dITP diphosphatase [bacterium]|nr:XTP/dITP diphosphatase [bacterium]
MSIKLSNNIHKITFDTLIVASHNPHKIEEIRSILSDFPVRILSLKELDWRVAHQEDGQSYYENAVKKAKAVVEHFGQPVLAEDSGLEVDALGGEPGIHSARYAGEGASDEANNQKLLAALSGVPASQRGARYRCTLVLMFPQGEVYSWEGTFEGRITCAPRGEGGFGYDPLFFVPEYGKTLAELGDEIKNKISHRARALAKLRKFFQNSC